jgi:hypothetical protein
MQAFASTMKKPMRMSGPSDHPPYRIRHRVTAEGLALAITDRIMLSSLFVPANDTDRFRW